MILNNKPENGAVLSNVGQIGEFRIRNSAKAFSILSSGLYANKVRAIIRELSCNAYDSHIAAGKSTTPFDVHLPNQLEPHFSIRDYGTGLDHEQMNTIYTTYFESTKTGSNDFVGALGLGSKSPFSYTDNFTVTTVKDGWKGIYSAFINGEGVPSVALMMEEETTDPNGVEVKFSVNDHSDFSQFREEAANVFKYFALRPVVSGNSRFAFIDPVYEDKDIIPGVHATKHDYYNNSSTAIMGNIAYPIAVPEADKTLGNLRRLLKCGLVMHFAIGDLDFQASREGLSYIPETITAIKKKLHDVNAALTARLAADASKIKNVWEKAIYLHSKKENDLWSEAVVQYIKDTHFKYIRIDRSYSTMHQFEIPTSELAKKFNIVMHAFAKSRGAVGCSNIRPDSTWVDSPIPGAKQIQIERWEIPIANETHFVVTDTKVGATERAKYHWKTKQYATDRAAPSFVHVYILDAADATKPMDTKGFFKRIQNPPNQIQASALSQKPKKVRTAGANVTITRLEEKTSGCYNRGTGQYVWRPAGMSDSFDSKALHYYVPLHKFDMISKYGVKTDVKDLLQDVTNVEGGIFGNAKDFGNIVLHGVRKVDLAAIQAKKNWINLEDHITNKLANLGDKFKLGLALTGLDKYELVCYNKTAIDLVSDKNSPYVKLGSQFEGVSKVRFNQSRMNRLCQKYAPTLDTNPEKIIKKFVEEAKALYERYPLFKALDRTTDATALAEYINLIDASKGVSK